MFSQKKYQWSVKKKNSAIGRSLLQIVIITYGPRIVQSFKWKITISSVKYLAKLETKIKCDILILQLCISHCSLLLFHFFVNPFSKSVKFETTETKSCNEARHDSNHSSNISLPMVPLCRNSTFSGSIVR